MKRTHKQSPFSLLASAVFFLATLVSGCSEKKQAQSLPFLGEKEVVQNQVEGKTVADTIYSRVPDFAFLNQDSQVVNRQTFAGRIYVTDFFFTTCPTICPKMKSQMLRVYEKFKAEPRVMLLSHSIDPAHDTVAVLRDYARRLQVSSDKWHFVTGDKDAIYGMAMKYLVTAMEDKAVPGGFTHSGHFVLVDGNQHIRGIYEGTEAESIDQLLLDIDLLLKEKKNGQP
ncbi:MAG: SCO family protein [Adhaeribacter sp.]